MTLNDLKAIIEAEINVPPTSQHFLQDGRPVTDNSISLTQMNVQEGDVVALAIQSARQRRRPAQGNPTGEPAQRPQTGNDPEQARLRILTDGAIMDECRRQDPELAAASSDQQKFHELWASRQRQYEQVQREKEEQYALLEADPFNADAQQKIEEIIRQERVAENLQKAMEENPECETIRTFVHTDTDLIAAFGRVTMLYIDVTVNNVPIKAFVDSGAQTTIMSPAAAERCGILRLIDKRYGGIARGVGTATILGRVHSADIQIGQYNLASSFTVMEGKDVDLLLGLDMLKRHQMCIDLQKNCLRVQNDEIQFLPENEIPKMMEEILENEPKLKGPDGSTIGATTGTVEPRTNPPASEVSNPKSSSSTPAQPSSSGSAAGPSNFGQSQPITAQSIAQITELGFSREEAIAALRQVDGNVELAIGLLI